MRVFCVSEMDTAALSLAQRLGIGLETIDFCSPENMESEDAIFAKQKQLKGITPLSLHAPYYELFPCAIDPMIRQVARHRFTQALEICKQLGIKRMIVHSGYNPYIYYPQWFVPKSIEFWKEFIHCLPDDFELMLENVLEEVPDYIREICDGVNDSRFKLCLDVGHANAYAHVPVEEWISQLGERIRHVHLNNNNGQQDEHAPLNCGNMDMGNILKKLDECAPDAHICIESMDAAACVQELIERGYMNVQSL